MTTAIVKSTKCDESTQEYSKRSHKSSRKYPSKSKSLSINIEIFKQMEINQKITKNYIDDSKLENLRNNFISWIFLVATKIDISNETIFNTISMLDNLISNLKKEEFAKPRNFHSLTVTEPRNFQLLAVTCFFISYKIFEKKTITIAFIENNLLHGKWIQDDIRRAEIFVLESLEYNIHLNNFFSFYQFFELLIKSHFEELKVKQIQHLAIFIMQKALRLKEFMFEITPLEQVIIILNTVFLVLQQLINFEIERYSIFFMELTNVTSRQQFNEFEKFSTLLINNLTFSEEFVDKFNKIL